MMTTPFLLVTCLAMAEAPKRPAAPSKPKATSPAGAASRQTTNRIRVPDPVAWQAALDRAGFSPGVIDGQLARKTRIALTAFQRYAGLPVTGQPDDATRTALGLDRVPATTHWVITPADKDLVGPWPRTWQEKAKTNYLGYSSLASLVAERGHCSLALLARLNPKNRLDRLSVGDVLTIPNVLEPAAPPRAARLEIDLSEKVAYVQDKAGRTVGLFHCSIAKDKAKRPRGSCKVIVVKEEPKYLFDPAMWPEVKTVKSKLLIPPGPRCPVGLCWIGLSLPGYGIHGTPEPELIGKTGSHGCFRLTNWDALRLGKMVRVGMPVRFTSRGESWAAKR